MTVYRACQTVCQLLGGRPTELSTWYVGAKKHFDFVHLDECPDECPSVGGDAHRLVKLLELSDGGIAVALLQVRLHHGAVQDLQGRNSIHCRILAKIFTKMSKKPNFENLTDSNIVKHFGSF